MRRPQNRAGFTLYQLLALIAILAILAAFLAPILARVRQAAMRAQSQNNLKQIMIAVHTYHDAYGRMCSGNDANNFSAHAHLLPFIEQDNLYKAIKFNQDSTAKANAFVRKMRIKTYMSPLDPLGFAGGEAGPTNYMFNAGTQASLANNDGVFYLNSNVRLVNIPDGTSNTIGVLETLRGAKEAKPTVARQHVLLKAKELAGLKPDAGVADFKAGKNLASNRGESWMDGRFLFGTINAGRKPNDERPDVSCEGQGGWGGPRSMMGTVNVGMCDGSVRGINVSRITFATWQNAMNRNDGMPLGNDF